MPKNSFNRARCPFLSEAGTCAIYAKRPLSCRSFTSPDAKLCEQSVVDGRNIPQQPVLHRIYQAVTTSLSGAAKKQGLYYEQVEFIPSLLEVLDVEKKHKEWRGYNL